MTLYVYDHGYRIQTPKEALFPKQGVDSLSKSRHIHRTADKEDRLHSDGEKFIIPGPGKPNQNKDPATLAYTANAEEAEPQNESAQLTVSTIMVSPVHTISPNVTVSTAWKRMLSLEISHLVIAEEDKRPLGLISKTDLIEAGTDSLTLISDIYSKQLIAATPETLVQSVAINFIDNEINSIPVVNNNDEIVGIVCRTDLLRLLVSGAHLERWV
ncbi:MULTISPECIES: HPP family protein [unclassified Neptuniibacter]|jgi:acetoin utilization protein AcuB|uniref:CBS domain-containing protein n=1 Tax=unclassified Neptuniibacter TaxID=2630693 RepID=UPI0026E3010F|nr:MULTISPECIES: CBS domain-containing protein [unclassified Neptuniibacter]MDO6515548.1 CBS domain-containing protein [Neptuniibacter sp. 2_MG-2023]MDO6592757.1 CBS domain-containing protein [Neptuniibacter sp. 1_MG-2023]